MATVGVAKSPGSRRHSCTDASPLWMASTTECLPEGSVTYVNGGPEAVAPDPPNVGSWPPPDAEAGAGAISASARTRRARRMLVLRREGVMWFPWSVDFACGSGAVTAPVRGWPACGAARFVAGFPPWRWKTRRGPLRGVRPGRSSQGRRDLVEGHRTRPQHLPAAVLLVRPQIDHRRRRPRKLAAVDDQIGPT